MVYLCSVQMKHKKNLKKIINDYKEISFRSTIIEGFQMSLVMAKTNKLIILESTLSATSLATARIMCIPIQREPHLQNFSVIHQQQACQVDSNTHIHRHINHRPARLQRKVIKHQCFLMENGKRMMGTVASTV